MKGYLCVLQSKAAFAEVGLTAVPEVCFGKNDQCGKRQQKWHSLLASELILTLEG